MLLIKNNFIYFSNFSILKTYKIICEIFINTYHKMTKILYLSATNIKIIIFISLLIIYLFLSDKILEHFVEPKCENITSVTLPHITIDSHSNFSIANIISKKDEINRIKRNNLNNVSKKYGCIENNFISKIRNI